MGENPKGALPSSPPTRRMMPPVMATRDLRSLSLPPQVVHFIPIQATPNPAMDTMMPTIIKARVAWSEPGEDGNKKSLHVRIVQEVCVNSISGGSE